MRQKNLQRARGAKTVLDHYRYNVNNVTREDESEEEMIIDLETDLLHYAQSEKLKPAIIIGVAKIHYNEEAGKSI